MTLYLNGTNGVSGVDGSAATPALQGTDSNTGIVFGTDTVAISTNGSQRVTVDSTGKVGVGIASPSESIHVFGSASAPNQKIRIQTHDTASAVAGIEFFSRDASNNNKISEIVTSNADLTFKTDNTERARIDSSGRLLVGTSTATNNVRLDQKVGVVGVGIATYTGIACTGYSGTTVSAAPVIDLQRSRGTTDGSFTKVESGDRLGVIAFRGADGTQFLDGVLIEAYADAATGANDLPTRLVFSTTADGASSPTEAMRINNQGRVSIGTQTISAKLSIWENASTNEPVRINDTNNTNGHTHRIGFRTGDVEAGKITSDRTSTNYVTTSDYRLKENIVQIADGIARLQQLKPFRFNFRVNPAKTVDGFLAHEVQEVVPEAISGTKDEVDADGNPVYQGIDQSKLVPLLTAALQEAIGRIETLEATNADLLARVTALEAA